MQKEKFFTTHDGQTFNLVSFSEKHDKLPPGIYSINYSSIGGLYYSKEKYDTSELISIEDDILDSCVKEIESFWTKKQLFLDHNFPFKRGILLYGPPGSGKTCALKLIVNNIVDSGGLAIKFSSAGVFTAGLQEIRSLQSDTPIVVLMEDIDDLLDQDEHGITNLLDGFEDNQNIVFIATTNNINDISDRIRNRPSRFDKRILVKPPSERVRKIYLESIASRSKTPISIPSEWINDSNGMSFAQLKELYLSIHILGGEYKEILERLKEMTPELEDYQYLKKYTKKHNPINALDQLIQNFEKETICDAPAPVPNGIG